MSSVEFQNWTNTSLTYVVLTQATASDPLPGTTYSEFVGAPNAISSGTIYSQQTITATDPNDASIMYFLAAVFDANDNLSAYGIFGRSENTVVAGDMACESGVTYTFAKAKGSGPDYFGVLNCPSVPGGLLSSLTTAEIVAIGALVLILLIYLM